MAVNLQAPSSLVPIKGIRLASTAAGIRYRDRPDLVLLEMTHGTQVAAVFTRNAFCAAPVIVAREHLAITSPRFLLVNAGNANAGTGAQGLQAARQTCRLLSDRAACMSEAVLPFSTGVIGEPLPVHRFAPALDRLLIDLDVDAWLDAAHAIMTTDTIPKGASCQLEMAGKTVNITGIAKGSGMIHPNMATMLAFIATDADIGKGLLHTLLAEAVALSFNSITVDGDTSTNDACILMATGASGVRIDTLNGKDLLEFKAALNSVCQELAQNIVRDGEGATKFVTLNVEEALNEEEARLVAFTIAHSPLVKTALFANDPNWGRILAAVGYSGIERLDISGVWMSINGLRVVSHGARHPDYTEEDGQKAMACDEIEIRVGLGRGQEKAQIWTTDLSHDYVRINAEYRS